MQIWKKFICKGGDKFITAADRTVVIPFLLTLHKYLPSIRFQSRGLTTEYRIWKKVKKDNETAKKGHLNEVTLFLYRKRSDRHETLI